MAAKRSLTVLFSSLLLFVAACSLPASTPAEPDLAATITAQAIIIHNSVGASTAAALPVTGNTNTPAGTVVSLNATTNCRTGPSSAYDVVFTAHPGPSFQVIGKYSSGNYWIIDNPAGGTCWLWGQYAVVTGDTAGLPQYPAPPVPPRNTKAPKATPTATSTATASGAKPIFPILTLVVPIVPNAPGGLIASRTCAGGLKGFTPIWIEDVTLTWTDSTREAGYHVYKDGALVSTLPADSTSYHIQLRYDQGTGGALFDTFGVEAFNNAGASSRPSLDIPVCP